MRTLLTLADRTAVLFLGVAAGAAIGYAFGVAHAPPPRPAAPAVAPPPPAAAAAGPPAAGPAVTAGTAVVSRPVAPPQAPELAQPVQPHLLGSLAEGRKVRIGVFGDSYGDGIWSALYRLLPAKAGYEVVKFSQQSTGFTRYASLNLEEHAREQLSGNPVDVAVISFGANDTQGVMVGRHAAPLLSAEWQEVVGQRVDGFVRELRAQGAVVYWVGLPKMRKASFDADIAGMNAFYAKRMQALGVPWIETASMTVDETGAFAPYLPDGPDGERTLIRAGDGIHMSMTGYVRITRGLARRIGDYVATARTKAAPDAPAAPLPAPAVPPREAELARPPADRPSPKRVPGAETSAGSTTTRAIEADRPVASSSRPATPKRSTVAAMGAEISKRAAEADRAASSASRRTAAGARATSSTPRRRADEDRTATPRPKRVPEAGRAATPTPKRVPERGRPAATAPAAAT